MKKIFTSLILVSLLAIPVVGLAQEGIKMGEPNTDWQVRHNLSDYSTCCYDVRGVQKCVQEGLITAEALKALQTNLGIDLTHCRLVDKVLTIGDWIFTAILVVAIIIILLAAFGFLTAAGDPDKVTKARNYLIYALIGVAVAFLAKVLVRVVASIMT